jgi:hypothetical protein
VKNSNKVNVAEEYMLTEEEAQGCIGAIRRSPDPKELVGSDGAKESYEGKELSGSDGIRIGRNTGRIVYGPNQYWYRTKSGDARPEPLPSRTKE